MARNSIRTTHRVARKASSLLLDGRTSGKTKSVAGSAMVNRKRNSKRG